VTNGNIKIIQLRKLIPKVLALYCSDAQLLKSIHLFLDKFQDLEKTRGLKFALIYFKRSRLHFTKYMSGQPLLSVDGVKILPTGMPVWINAIVSELDLNNPNVLRMILTGLTIGRCFNLSPVLDTKTITDEWKGVLPNISEREHQHILRSLGIKKFRWEWSEFHFSTKSGPNGPAMLTSLTDLTYLPLSLKNDIFLVGGRYLKEVMTKLSSATMDGKTFIEIWNKMFPSRDRGLFKKLSYFSDKEGKTRVIAILDYWSQTSLKPLHTYINSVLRRITSDCTYNQNHFLKCLPTSGPYYSLDLTAATDRMPIILQNKILASIVGEDKADAWVRILIQNGYSLPDGKSVLYNTGQPMGAYSSWPVMALTHHYIVRLAALKCGFLHFTAYALLGDDIVIANTVVAEKYIELLKILDMPLSEHKTHISLTTYEFAKRWIHNNIEITPYSFSGLYETWKQYPLLSNFIENQELHGWDLEDKGNSGKVLEVVYNHFGKFSQVKRTSKLYNTFTMLNKFLKETNLMIKEEIAYKIQQFLAYPRPEEINIADFTNACIQSILIEQGKEDQKKLLESQRDMLRFTSKALLRVYLSPQEWEAIEIELRNKRPIETLGHLIPTSVARLTMSIRRTIQEYHPINGAVGKINRDLTESLIIVENGTPEQLLNVFMKKEFASFISTDIFSMRSANQRLLSQSRLVKGYMSKSKSFFADSLNFRDFNP